MQIGGFNRLHIGRQNLRPLNVNWRSKRWSNFAVSCCVQMKVGWQFQAGPIGSDDWPWLYEDRLIGTFEVLGLAQRGLFLYFYFLRPGQRKEVLEM